MADRRRSARTTALAKGADMDARLRQLRESIRRDKGVAQTGRRFPPPAAAPAAGFSLLSVGGGAVDVGVLSKQGGEAGAVDEYIAHARQERQRDFADIEDFRYDEREEMRAFSRDGQHADEVEQPLAQQLQRPPPQAERTHAAPTVAAKQPARHTTPPRVAPQPRPPAGTSPARPVRILPKSQPASIWGVYDLSSEGRTSLKAFGARGQRKSVPAATQRKGAACPAAATSARAAELRQLLLAAPPPGAGPDAVAAHEALQRAALAELQKLQSSRGPAPAPAPTSAPAESGGSLLSGTVDEERNRSEFAQALREWRRSGPPAKPATDDVAVDATLSDQPGSSEKRRRFERGLHKAVQFVYFEHLRDRLAIRQDD